ncbi:hypothetical protein COB55_04140 [Candidatus Wolfebacteria bacterium]|nr:MAG: hypothetical protein COB55_04140 [Candidatus Wolfebacteria bacterium]
MYYVLEYAVFDYYSISLLLGFFVALVSGFVVFLHNRTKEENLAWFLLNISSAVWSLGYFIMVTTRDHDVAWLSNLTLHAAAIFLPLAYFLFILRITKTFEKHKGMFFLTIVPALIFLVMNPTSYFVKDVIPKGPFNFAPEPGPLYAYFAFYFFAVVIYSLVITFKKFLSETNYEDRQRLKYILIFTIAGFGGGGSVFLLTFNTGIPPYPLILFSLYPIISGYAIFRHQLFDLKVVTTELFVFSLWVAIALQTLISESTQNKIFGVFVLALAVVAGTFLTRSVIKEVKSREEIAGLAENLKKANSKLKEIDQKKSEFISIATHQIRGPLAAIKGYASLMLEGSFGSIENIKQKEAVERILHSSSALVLIVNDFLDISRIDLGRLKYACVNADFRDIAEKTMEEMTSSVEQAGLSVSFSDDNNGPYIINADVGKMQQVVGNLLDNAVKYTKEGSIEIKLMKKGNRIQLAISDTGIGMSKETIPILFEKFSRAENASTANVMGSGLGLYVVRQLVEDHRGRVWATSDGEGKGSTFIVELPVVGK